MQSSSPEGYQVLAQDLEMKHMEGAVDFVSTKVSVLVEMEEAGERVLSYPQVYPLGTHIFNEKTPRTPLGELWIEWKQLLGGGCHF